MLSYVETADRITQEVESRKTDKFNQVRILIHVEPSAYKSNQISF
jgi:divalent metal cation (Fe/Co/Zn/Cd) transporter